MTFQDVQIVGEVYHKTDDGRVLIQCTQHYTTKSDIVVKFANVVVQTENKDVQLRMQKLEEGNLVEFQGEFLGNEYGSPPIHNKSGNPFFLINAFNVFKLAESADESRDSDKFQITFVGNAGGDVEMRYKQDGNAFTAVSIAVNKKKNAGKENEEEITTWLRATDWWGDLENGKLRWIKKGNRVLIKANVSFDAEAHGPKPWTHETTGEVRGTFDVNPLIVRSLSGGGNGHSVSYETATEDIDIPF